MNQYFTRNQIQNEKLPANDVCLLGPYVRALFIRNIRSIRRKTVRGPKNGLDFFTSFDSPNTNNNKYQVPMRE